jgi:excisionase family DNA binding protein
MRVPKRRRVDGAGYFVPAAAEALGVSYKTLREAIALKQVRVIQFGGRPRVPRSEVDRLLKMFRSSKPDST